MKKKLMIFLTTAILMFSLVGCSIPEDTQTSESNSISKINNDYVYEFIDSYTGVHYLLSIRGGMIPRLNSDGSIMCDK